MISPLGELSFRGLLLNCLDSAPWQLLFCLLCFCLGAGKHTNWGSLGTKGEAEKQHLSFGWGPGFWIPWSSLQWQHQLLSQQPQRVGSQGGSRGKPLKRCPTLADSEAVGNKEGIHSHQYQKTMQKRINPLTACGQWGAGWLGHSVQGLVAGLGAEQNLLKGCVLIRRPRRDSMQREP